MTDQFDFPQPSKRRKVSTYGTRRSTLHSNQVKGLLTEKSAPLRKASGVRDLQEAFLDVSAHNNEDSNLAVEEPHISTTIPLSNAVDNATTSIATKLGAAKRNRRTFRSSEKGRIESGFSKHEVNEGGDLQTNAAANEIVALDHRSTPSPPATENGIEEGQDVTATIQPRSSGRERKRPRRFSISPQKPKPKAIDKIDSPAVNGIKPLEKKKSSDTPRKGILTPSKRAKHGPRKSVAFDREEKDVEQHFGFRDISTSAKSVANTTEYSSPAPLSKDGVAVGNGVDPDPPIPQSTEVENGNSAENMDDDFLIEQMIQTEQSMPQSSLREHPIAASQVNEEDPSLLAIKSTVLTRLIGQSNSRFASVPIHLQSGYNMIHDILTATISTGESNSILLLGSRGSGKSQLLAHALADLDTTYHSEFHVVRLNGFFQTDDKVALREIWRQLGREMSVDESETEEVSGSYADTMASLLSLLSHPEEHGESLSENENTAADGRRCQTTSKAVIFTLDEFDLFTTHPRQTLLYNLFDIAQSRKAPIAVIGSSTRMDVVECLEKRVKSRFSHRWVHMPSTRSIDGFEEILKAILCVEVDLKVPKSEHTLRQRWNEHMQKTFLPSSAVQAFLKRVYYTSKAIPDLFTALHIPIATVQLPPISSTTGKAAAKLDTLSPIHPSPLTVLLTIPTVHLSLLIAAARLDAIHNLTAVNFNLVYDHYSDLITRSKLHQTTSGALAVGASLKQWNRETIKGAWEDLGNWHLILPVSNGVGGKDGIGDSVGGEGASVRMCRVDATLDELSWALKERGAGTAEILGKWCREV